MGCMSIVLTSSMMLALTGVKSYYPNSFPLLQMTPLILRTVPLAAKKNTRSGLCRYLWYIWLIMIVQLIERGPVVIPTGPMIKDSRHFSWILLKEAKVVYICHNWQFLSPGKMKTEHDATRSGRCWM